MPFPVNIDIRDTVKYKSVMKEYGLGPNGAIMTSLNLFTTQFDQVLKLVEARSKTHDYVLVDTPGQIEVQPLCLFVFVLFFFSRLCMCSAVFVLFLIGPILLVYAFVVVD